MNLKDLYIDFIQKFYNWKYWKPVGNIFPILLGILLILSHYLYKKDYDNLFVGILLIIIGLILILIIIYSKIRMYNLENDFDKEYNKIYLNSSRNVDKYILQRRKKDKIFKISKKNGFIRKRHGRLGYIYYVEDNRICEIEYEQSGSHQFDILIFYDRLKNWFYPEIMRINDEELNEIKNKLIRWLKLNNIRYEL